jgi:hypothetical protein
MSTDDISVFLRLSPAAAKLCAHDPREDARQSLFLSRLARAVEPATAVELFRGVGIFRSHVHQGRG